MTIDISEQSEKDLAAYLERVNELHLVAFKRPLSDGFREVITEAFKAGYTKGAVTIGKAVVEQAQLTYEITDALKKN